MLFVAQLERPQLLEELAATRLELGRLVPEPARKAGAQAEEVDLQQVVVGPGAQLVESDEELLAGEQVVVVVHLQRLAAPLLGAGPGGAHHGLVDQGDHRVLRVAARVESLVLDAAARVGELRHDVRPEGAVPGPFVVARATKGEDRREGLAVSVGEGAHGIRLTVRAPRSSVGLTVRAPRSSVGLTVRAPRSSVRLTVRA